MKLIVTDSKGRESDDLPILEKGVYVLALDSSTSRSGVCVMSVGGQLGFVCAVVRGTESMAAYKVSLKNILTLILTRFNIKHAVYEEPFIGYVGDVKGLFMMATSLEEIVAESGLDLWVSSVNNKRWKKQFLDRKLEGGSEVQKKMVRARALQLYPGLTVLEKNKVDYDETDALGLAWYLARCVREDVLDSMASQGRPHKFAYNIVLVGGTITSDEAVKIVGRPLKDGVITADITGKKSFDAAVYTLLRGKNAILLVYFKSGKFGDIILKHGGGTIAAQNNMISAVVTRKSSTRAKK